MLNDNKLYHDWVNWTRRRGRRFDGQSGARCTRDREISFREALQTGYRLALRCRSGMLEIAGEVLGEAVIIATPEQHWHSPEAATDRHRPQPSSRCTPSTRLAFRSEAH